MPTTYLSPPMQPPEIPLQTGDNDADIERLFSYLNDLLGYLLTHQPSITVP